MKIEPITSSSNNVIKFRKEAQKTKSLPDFEPDSVSFKSKLQQPKMKYDATKELSAFYGGIVGVFGIPAAFIIGLPYALTVTSLATAIGAVTGLYKDVDEYLEKKQQYENNQN